MFPFRVRLLSVTQLLAILCWTCALQMSAAAPPAKQDELLRSVARAHRAAVESIQTIECDVRVEVGNKEFAEVAKGHYLRSGDRVRLTESRYGWDKTEILFENSVGLQLSQSDPSHRKPEGTPAVRQTVGEAVFPCDVWRWMLLDFPASDLRHMSLDEFLRCTVAPPRAERVREGSRDLIHLTAVVVPPSERDWDHLECWFDPKANYLVRKQVRWRVNSKLRIETEIPEFREAAPGVFVPVRRITETKPGGRKVVTTLTNVRVNEPIVDERFKLNLPAGTVVIDKIERKKYRVDALGRPAEELQAVEPAAAPAVSAGQEPIVIGHQTQAEHSNNSLRWIALSGCAALVIAVAVWKRGAGQRATE